MGGRVGVWGVVAGGLCYGGAVMRAIEPEVVDTVWDAIKDRITVRKGVSSFGLSPA